MTNCARPTKSILALELLGYGVGDVSSECLGRDGSSWSAECAKWDIFPSCAHHLVERPAQTTYVYRELSREPEYHDSEVFRKLTIVVTTSTESGTIEPLKILYSVGSPFHPSRACLALVTRGQIRLSPSGRVEILRGVEWSRWKGCDPPTDFSWVFDRATEGREITGWMGAHDDRETLPPRDLMPENGKGR